MPREVVLYNPEVALPQRLTNRYTYKLKYEALRGVHLDLQYELHQFKSRNELEQQLQYVFVSHRTKPIDKVVIDVHGDIVQGEQVPEGIIGIDKYAGDFIGQIRYGDRGIQTVTATQLVDLLRNIRSPIKIPELRLFCCDSGLLSVTNNIARTFLRSNLFNYVVAEDMAVWKRINKNIFKTRMSLTELDKDYQPHISRTPNPNSPNSSTETFLRYCAPGNDYRPSEETVVFYNATNSENNLLIERWDNYRKDLPFADLSSHPGKDFPPSVTTPKQLRVRRFPCIP